MWRSNGLNRPPGADHEQSTQIVIEAGETYRKLDLSGRDLRRADLEGTTFVDCVLARAILLGARCNAARFERCDLSGARLAGCNLFGAVFNECKLLGVDAHDGVTLTGISFANCNLDYALFRGVSLRKMRIDACSFRDADFSHADLREATFSACELSGVDITAARFQHTDLRGSNLTGWNLNTHDLAGIVISPAQFESLAFELGIQIVANG